MILKNGDNKVEFSKEIDKYYQAYGKSDYLITDNNNAPLRVKKIIYEKRYRNSYIELVKKPPTNFAFVEGGKLGDKTLENLYVSKYEVTQKEYREIMGTNPSKFKGDNNPVESVTWYDAIRYANKLSEKEGLAPYYKILGEKYDSLIINGGNGYRLPTIAEWEYVARGGKLSKGFEYAGSNDLEKVAWVKHWIKQLKELPTQPVGKKIPNELGIYDMNGNVYEWCEDLKENNRLVMGLSSNFTILWQTKYTLSDYEKMKPDTSNYETGFRLVRNVNLDTSKKTENINVENTYDDVFQKNFVLVNEGTFTMGNTFGDGKSNEEPTHSVTLDSYYMSKYEVTLKEYRELMGYNPSDFDKDNNPVGQVTWYDAVMYANRLSENEGIIPYYNISSVTKEGNRIKNATVTIAGGKGYRLPTEAEWEYAARGGSQSKGYKYSGSNNIDEVAWYGSYGSSNAQVVGQKKANELGIYDMSGNVDEWCWDWYDDNYYYFSDKTNPTGHAGGDKRVYRGGDFYFSEEKTSVSFRDYHYPNRYFESVGFRLVRSY